MNHLKKFETFNSGLSPQALEAFNVIDSIMEDIGEIKIEESENCSNPPEYWCFDKINSVRKTWNWIQIWKDGTITYPTLKNEILSRKRSGIPITWEDRKWFKNLLIVDGSVSKNEKYLSQKDENSIIDYLDSINL